MERTKKIIILAAFGAFLLLHAVSVNAQGGPPPPPPGEGHGQTTNLPPQGGNAPVGGGLLILLGLSALYGTRRVYFDKKQE